MSTPTEPPGSLEPPGPSRRTALLIGLGGGLVVLALMGVAAFFSLTQGPNAVMSIGGPFNLLDGDGRPVTQATFRGKYFLVYFGYTFCPDVCPTTLNQVAEAIDRLGPKADRVVPVFITVDPKRDTPAVVKEFSAAFSPRIVGLTGSAEEIAKAERAYRVYAAERHTGPGVNDYTMDHSSILYLMGPDGNFLTPIRAEETGEQIAAELSRFVR
jgi:protein SCO1